MLKIAIPFVDLRGKTPVDLLRSYPDKAQSLIACARRMYGAWSAIPSLAALPLADWRSRRWLKRTGNPYLHEIESMTDVVGSPGIYTLNLCYEWGCSSGAYRTGETVTMLRVLDWPFPDLGRQVMVVLQKGKAGEFYNMTWPGLTGVYTAMAPQRFAAAINQAPMRRHGLGFAGDWIRNRFIAGGELGLPPSHLLRQVCEQAENYDAAKEMLIRTPVAVPVIYVLSGLEPGQGCVIERLENAAEIFDLSAHPSVTSANHFMSQFAGFGRGWRPREIDSAGRHRECSALAGHDLEDPHFAWLRPPIINLNTRLAVLCDAASMRLMVQGFDGTVPATGIFVLQSPGERKQAV